MIGVMGCRPRGYSQPPRCASRNGWPIAGVSAMWRKPPTRKPPSSIYTISGMRSVRRCSTRPYWRCRSTQRPRKPRKPPGEEDEAEAEAEAAKPGAYAIRGYLWSPDETRLLFAHAARPHFAGDPALYLYTLATNTFQMVTPWPGAYRNAKWSPDGKWLGYVRDNDLYLLELATGQETRLTESPSSTIYNGRLGWVYEEELDLADGWAWSPDGNTIAYFQMDEAPVPKVDLFQLRRSSSEAGRDPLPESGRSKPARADRPDTGRGTGNREQRTERRGAARRFRFRRGWRRAGWTWGRRRISISATWIGLRTASCFYSACRAFRIDWICFESTWRRARPVSY